MPRSAPSHALRSRYVLALGVVAALTLASQGLIQVLIASATDDAALINDAGRQRMRSQRLAKAALLLEAERPDPEALAEFVATASELRATHEDLRSASRGSRDLQRRFEPLTAAFDQLLAPLPPSEGVPIGREVLDAAKRFLPEMDAFVTQLQLESQARVERLRWTEVVLAVVTLLVLMAEGLLVFEPLRRRLAIQFTELTQARDDAQAGLAARSAFQASMSHELRTPLNGVLGMCELLRDTNLNDEQAELAATCERSARSLLGLIEDVFDAARVQPAPVVVNESPFELRALIEGIADAARQELAEASVEMRLELLPSLPVRASGDRARVERILKHLIGNAAKFTTEGHVEVTAGMGQPGSGPVLEVQIRDTGPGIAAVDLPRVVEPFVRLTRATGRDVGGAGLGLTIVKRLVDSMGGELTLSSSLGVGTQVRVVLPMSPVACQVRPSTCELRGCRVLVAEDNPVNLRVLLSALAAWGCDVDVAVNGQLAVELARERSFDFVLMDLQMPVMTGFDAAIAIQSEPLNACTPILAVTANGDADSVERCRALGFAAHVVKPLDREELRTTMERCAPWSRSISDAA